MIGALTLRKVSKNCEIKKEAIDSALESPKKNSFIEPHQIVVRPTQVKPRDLTSQIDKIKIENISLAEEI